MRKITIILLAVMMVNGFCGCGDKIEYPKAIDMDTVEDFYDGETRYLPDEENMLTISDESEGGFLVKEKRFTYEYKDYILFDIINETDKNYNLTVHAKYFDAEGKRLDETWEIYSDFAAGHQQYILLDPDIKFAECECDFQVKETEIDCWRTAVIIEASDMFVSEHAKDSLNSQLRIENNSDKHVYVYFKGLLVFDTNGKIYTVIDDVSTSMRSSEELYISALVGKISYKDNSPIIPEELKAGYIGIPVIEKIVETK